VSQINGPAEVGIGQSGMGQNLCAATILICALVILLDSRGNLHLNSPVLRASIVVGPVPVISDLSTVPPFSSTISTIAHANWTSIASNNTLGLETVNRTSNGFDWSGVPSSMTRAAGHSGGSPESAKIDETIPIAATVRESTTARTRTNDLTTFYSKTIVFLLVFSGVAPPLCEQGCFYYFGVGVAGSNH
jgi:hypothetical protein